MSAAVGPGSLVRCVKDSLWAFLMGVPGPVSGAVYTIREVIPKTDPFGAIGFCLVEVADPPMDEEDEFAGAWSSNNFVSVDEGQLDWARDLTHELEDA